MKISCWYKSGNVETLHQFCIQNQDKPISVKLANRSEPVKGALHSYNLNSSKAAGLFLLLTDRVIHPAYYGLAAIESLNIGFDETWSPRVDSVSPKDRLPTGIIASRRLALRSAR
jgi:hypothetical protein